MKRHASSDQLISLCPSGEEKGLYGRGFSLLEGVEEDEYGDEEMISSIGGSGGGGGGGGGGGEKKRRLNVEQVRALEKNFEVENKLEPERKQRLAQELGLQPRQVAVWFQNRRARWKTKRLERDFAALKGSYDALRLDYDALHRDKEKLQAELDALKAKLGQPNISFSSVKEEEEEEEEEEELEPVAAAESETKAAAAPALESDSSAVLSDELLPPAAAAFENSSQNCFATASSPLLDSRAHKGGFYFYQQQQQQHQHQHQHQQQQQYHLMMKVEEGAFFGGEEPCSSLFSEEQAPSLAWYYSENWN